MSTSLGWTVSIHGDRMRDVDEYFIYVLTWTWMWWSELRSCSSKKNGWKRPLLLGVVTLTPKWLDLGRFCWNFCKIDLVRSVTKTKVLLQKTHFAQKRGCFVKQKKSFFLAHGTCTAVQSLGNSWLIRNGILKSIFYFAKSTINFV